MGWYLLGKNLLLFKVREGKSKGSNFIKSLSYIFYTTDALAIKVGVYYLLITKPSTTKWTYTDNDSVTYITTSHTMGGGGILLCRATKLVCAVLILVQCSIAVSECTLMLLH